MNFERIAQVIEDAEARSRASGKSVEFVVTTNLALVTGEMLEYFRDHNVLISTSLDGPEYLHNANRPRPGNNSYELTIRNMKRAREVLGFDKVGALMTATRLSLQHPREIVDEYVSNGFQSIFLRNLSPYGFALKTARSIGYTVDDFLPFYREALDYIIEVNRTGINFVELYAQLLLTRILTPFSTGYEAHHWNVEAPLVHSTSALDYLSDGDVVYINEGGFVRTLYRRNSPHNFILVTDQCNSYCLMCSQPPKQVNDFDRIYEHLRLIDLIDPETRELGITGGEPTLFKDDFLRLIEYCKSRLPGTALHVLTNGRLFYYREFARRLAEIGHPDMMLGIPVYSDADSEHDYVVQARGAFEETVLGLHNLARYNVPVEIRVVIHLQTYRRLPRIAEFIARNLPFASHIALMGLEMFGFVNANMSDLWIDPHDYQAELKEASETLFLAGLNVSIYNHQLCVLDRSLWPFARKSISDWKNIYLEPCDQCSVRAECGGLFQSAAKKHSDYIRPLSVAY